MSKHEKVLIKGIKDPDAPDLVSEVAKLQKEVDELKKENEVLRNKVPPGVEKKKVKR